MSKIDDLKWKVTDLERKLKESTDERLRYARIIMELVSPGLFKLPVDEMAEAFASKVLPALNRDPGPDGQKGTIL